jgi:F-type H+-transporting ATPase subunit delta
LRPDGARLRVRRASPRVRPTWVEVRGGGGPATVTSARELPPEHYTQIQTALEKATGKHVLLDRSVDETLLGGVIAKLGDTVYDGSVRTQLEKLRETILS